MKDFAKSIVCNTKAEAEKTGNSYSWTERRGHQELYDPTVPFGGHVRGYVEKSKNGYTGAKTNGSILIAKKEFATEEEAKKFVENKKTGNRRVGNELTSYEKAKKSDLEKRLKKEEQLLEDAKKMLRSKLSDDDRIGFQMQKEECEKNVSRLKEEIRKIGNSKTGNTDIVKDGNTWVVLYAEGTKSKEFDNEAEAKRFAAQVGNSKIGNADILSGNYIILADNGEVWFRDEHENVHIRNIDSWAQKRIASYQSSIDEIKKGVAEAKQAAKKAGMI